MKGKSPESKRYEGVQQYGYDLKFAYHTVRLILEVEQIFTTGDINLRRDAQLLRAIRNGEWTEEHVRTWFTEKERSLESLYNSSEEIPYKPDEEAIKLLLLSCLEAHYGKLSQVLLIENKYLNTLFEIKGLIEEVI